MSHFGRSGPPDIKDSYSLLVLNITFRTTADDLYPLFDRYGKVVDIFIPRDRRTGDSRGFAFVRYKYADEAEKAIERLDGKNVDGRDIVVQFAKYGPNAEVIDKGRLTAEPPTSKRYRSRSPRRSSRRYDDYKYRDYRKRSRSHDRYERHRYREREREYRRRSPSGSVSPCSRSRSRSRSQSLSRDDRRKRSSQSREDRRKRSPSHSMDSGSPARRSRSPPPSSPTRRRRSPSQSSPSPAKSPAHGSLSPNARSESPRHRSVSPSNSVMWGRGNTAGCCDEHDDWLAHVLLRGDDAVVADERVHPIFAVDFDAGFRMLMFNSGGRQCSRGVFYVNFEVA